MSRETFGQEASRLLFGLFEKAKLSAKLSGQPRAMARENIEPLMVALLDDLAARRPVTKKAKTPQQKAGELDEIWLCELEQNQVYAGIDVRRELGKLQAWCSVNPGKRATRKRFIGWLNRAEPSIALNGQGKSSFAPKSKGDLYKAPDGWQGVLLKLPFDPDTLKEQAKLSWLDVMLTLRQEVLRRIA